MISGRPERDVRNEFTIFSGSANPTLAATIARELGSQVGALVADLLQVVGIRHRRHSGFALATDRGLLSCSRGQPNCRANHNCSMAAALGE